MSECRIHVKMVDHQSDRARATHDDWGTFRVWPDQHEELMHTYSFESKDFRRIIIRQDVQVVFEIDKIMSRSEVNSLPNVQKFALTTMWGILRYVHGEMGPADFAEGDFIKTEEPGHMIESIDHELARSIWPEL